VAKLVLIVLGSLFAFWFVVVPLFERFAPTRVVRAYQRLAMPLFRTSAGLVPGFGVIETKGRRTGLPRRTPVGGRLRGDTFWFVAGIGRRTYYMRNIEADPHVRVKALGKWHSGIAHLCPEDNANKRMFSVSPINGFFLLLAGGDHLSVRVDLDT
jgi:deazaflavin-dependent oxidoreductase (nitroreductase family)